MLDFDQIARLSLAAVGLALLLLSLCSSTFNRMLSWRHAPELALLAVALSKSAAYVVLYHWLALPPPSDVPAFYQVWALQLDQGGLPYREVDYAFQPYYGLYLLAAWSLWPDPRTFIVAALLCHITAVWVLRQVARPWLDRGQTTLLILLLGADPLWTGNALMGQDESYVILLGVLGLLALQRGRPVLAGAIFGAQFLATKLVVALQGGPLTLAGGRRAIFAAAGTVTAGYALVVALGLNPFHPIAASWPAVEAVTHGNLPYLLTLLGIPLHPNLRLYDIVLLVGLLTTFIYVRGFQPLTLERGVLVGTVLLLTWTVLSRKSWYEELFIVFLPLLCGRFAPFKAACFLWLALATLAALNASLWFSLMNFRTFEDGGGSALFAISNLAQVALKTTILLYLLRVARQHVLHAKVIPPR